MAKLPQSTTETISNLKQQLLDIIDEATAVEFDLFERYGETERTIPFLEELKNVSERATPWFSRLSNAQIRIAHAQPIVPRDMIDFVNQAITQIEFEIPPMERSVQEVKIEWNLL